TEVSTLISTLTTSAAPSAQIESIAKSLPDLIGRLDARNAETNTTLETSPPSETLQSLQQQWQRHQVEATTWLNELTLQATRLQDGMNQLADLKKLWGNTRTSAQESKAPGPILEQIEATLTSISEALAKLQAERGTVLDLQSHVAHEVTKCTAALARISQFQQKAVAGIFVPDAPPIWRVEPWADAIGALPEHIRNVRDARWVDLANYARDPRHGFALHAMIFIVLSLVFAAARRKIEPWQKSGASTTSTLSVFARPFSAALATTLLIATSPFFQLSNTVWSAH